MRCTGLVLPLALATLLACQPDDPSNALAPAAPETPVPSVGTAALKVPNNYFLIFDSDPARNYTTTIGLVSPVSDLEVCGGSGPELFDGGGSTQIVTTPAGAVHVRDELHQATIVFYEGPTDNVCELATHRVLGTGRGNLHFTVKDRANGSETIQATFGGILNLAEGGRARMLGVGNIVFDTFGNVTVHEDHFSLKPIGH
jgi:hypothetical protein